MFIASQCPTKPFHIVKWIVGIKKKLVQNMTKSREIFSAHLDRNKVCKESHWFHQGKACASKVDNKSYAQVVASSNNAVSNRCIDIMNNLKVPSQGLTVRPLVKDTSVSKFDRIVQNNSQGSAVWVNVTKPLGHHTKLGADSVALNNRFQVLADLQNDSTEILLDNGPTECKNHNVPNRVLENNNISTRFDYKTGGRKETVSKSCKVSVKTSGKKSSTMQQQESETADMVVLYSKGEVSHEHTLDTIVTALLPIIARQFK